MSKFIDIINVARFTDPFDISFEQVNIYSFFPAITHLHRQTTKRISLIRAKRTKKTLDHTTNYVSFPSQHLAALMAMSGS